MTVRSPRRNVLARCLPLLAALASSRISPSLGADAGAAAEVLVRFAGDPAPFRKLSAGRASPALAAAEWSRRPGVLWAEANGTMSLCQAPDDPGYPFQWNLQNPVNGGLQVEAAWTALREAGLEPGAGALVAIVDTGVAYESEGRFVRAPDFEATRFEPGWNFVASTSHPNDDEGHGTHICGTVAAGTGDGTGFAGIAPRAGILPVKVMDRTGNGSFDHIARGIRFAADAGVDAINLSLGGITRSRAVEEAVAYAADRGCLVIAAAGNLSNSRPYYPAAHDRSVLAVSATRFDEARAWYSNHARYVDLAAPGGDGGRDQNRDGVPDAIFQQTFRQDPAAIEATGKFGTSMACPHVTGVAALLFGLGIEDDAEVRRILQRTARDRGRRGWDPVYGWGVLDAAAAVRAGLAGSPAARRSRIHGHPVLSRSVL